MKAKKNSLQTQSVKQNKKVLLVEAIENMRVATARMLIDMGFKEVIQAKNGLDALNYLRENIVDIIISDWIMPKMDGLTLLQNVRKELRTKEIPFIMSTTLVDHDSVKAAIKAGVSEYVAKPFNFSSLSEHIRKAFSNPLNKRLKSAKANVGEAPVEVERRKPQNNFVVLLVDDIDDDSHVITDVLKPQVRIKLASNGKEALTQCHSPNPPDLVLLGTNMAHLNWQKLLEVLKNNGQSQNIPVILLTAENPINDIIKKGFELGIVDYINKPINPAVVNTRVIQQKRLWQYQHSHKEQLETLIENFRMKEDLERIVQHDLNNPLSAIISFAEDSHHFSENAKRVDNNTRCILSTANMVRSMVSNMFTVIKIEDGNYTIEQTDFNLLEVLKLVITTFIRQIRDKHLLVNLDIAPHTCISGDKSTTFSLFANLFMNAVEATPKGSKISITAQAFERHIEIELHNPGAVPESIRPHFFEKYATASKSKKVGIGAYAAKLFCEIQQGSLHVRFEDAATRLIVRLCKGLPADHQGQSHLKDK